MYGVIGRLYAAPAVCGRDDKIWLRCESGEGGDFCRDEFEAALGADMACGEVDRVLERFFWENF